MWTIVSTNGRPAWHTHAVTSVGVQHGKERCFFCLFQRVFCHDLSVIVCFPNGVSHFVHCSGFHWRSHNVISVQCSGCEIDGISNKRGSATGATVSSRRWPNASTSAVGHVHEWKIEIVTVPTHCLAKPQPWERDLR